MNQYQLITCINGYLRSTTHHDRKRAQQEYEAAMFTPGCDLAELWEMYFSEAGVLRQNCLGFFDTQAQAYS
jgi:hypothetical protein